MLDWCKTLAAQHGKSVNELEIDDLLAERHARRESDQDKALAESRAQIAAAN